CRAGFRSDSTMQQEWCKRPIQKNYRRDQRKNVTSVMPNCKKLIARKYVCASTRYRFQAIHCNGSRFRFTALSASSEYEFIKSMDDYRHQTGDCMDQKRPGVFMADWWDANGRRHRKQFKNAALAKEHEHRETAMAHAKRATREMKLAAKSAGKKSVE